MTLTECTVRSCPIDLISTNHFRIASIAAAIGYSLGLEVFSFVVGVITQAIKEGESLSRDKDGDLGPKLNIATRLATNNRSDVCLIEAHDAIRDASIIYVIKNGLLAHQLTDHKQLLIDVPSGGQKAATAGNQGIDARQIPL